MTEPMIKCERIRSARTNKTGQTTRVGVHYFLYSKLRSIFFFFFLQWNK